MSALLVIALPLAAQSRPGDSTATVRVRVQHDGAPVSGAIVRSGSVAQQTDASGQASLRLPLGSHDIITSRLGFVPDTVAITLSAGQDTSITIALEAQAAEMESVVITSTRTARRVEDSPLRVEVVDEEEVAEKTAMTPGDIAMMLNETSGLRVQTTSPSLGGASVRVQGLRGRYTLLLADGLPLYGGQAGGLGLLQIPPVDLARAEVIKGTASALYGSSALGGVVNLVSRRPDDEPTRELLVNQTSRGGSDLVVFASQRLGSSDDDEKPLGGSLLVSAHRQRANDLDDDGWADMPEYERLVARPRLFVDRGPQSVFATLGVTAEDRDGGTLDDRVAPDGLPYVEALRTRRVDAGAVGRWVLGARDVLAVRGSAVEQRHRHRFGPSREHDRHRTWFTEASLALPRGLWTYVVGAAYQSERYRNEDVAGFDFDFRVPSVFAQADVDPARWLALSASARTDWHNEYATIVSPRVSALLRMPGSSLAGWTVRLSGGGGTFAPVPFTEETEVSGLAALRPLEGLEAERALGGSVDVNGPVRTRFGDFELNATLFASRLSHAVAAIEIDAVPDSPEPPPLVLVNAPLMARTWGAELLARLVRGPARVTATYAYLRATEWDPDAGGDVRRDVPLAPRHTAGVVGSLEEEEQYRVGLEVYYTGRQALEDNPYRATSRPYVVVGLLGERWVATPAGVARVFLNLENIGNVRQTRYDPLLLPARGKGGRWTTDAWTELSGFTLNGGVRLTL
ncbi:MAG TPA: TonB-dependent receptor plug domain-containing protein [Gemmatimonadaceae bacterium]|nr:TonB-dependent receptor plug domain-containing protein [Gemmatimonadaceae bacterium]